MFENVPLIDILRVGQQLVHFICIQSLKLNFPRLTIILKSSRMFVVFVLCSHGARDFMILKRQKVAVDRLLSVERAGRDNSIIITKP